MYNLIALHNASTSSLMRRTSWVTAVCAPRSTSSMASSMFSIRSPMRKVSRAAFASARLGVARAAGSRWRGLAVPLVSGRSGSSQAQSLAIGPTLGSSTRHRTVL
ncbi:hypothetical protein D3C76_1099070 [compost metagenome]